MATLAKRTNNSKLSRKRTDLSTLSFFNEPLKRKFLEDMVKNENISEETAKNYERILLLTSELEKKLNKDLNEFDFKELETVLYNYKSNNRNTIETYARIISSYLNWSVKSNLIQHNELEHLKPDDFVKYLLEGEIYYTEKQLRRWENRMENYQDAVIVRLLFLGVGGKQLSELRNLKISDVDRENKKIRLVNTLTEDKATGLPIKYGIRYLDIKDEYTFDLIEGAFNQRTYMKRNAEVSEGNENRSIGALDLVINNYVVRSSITKTENFSYPVDKFVIYRRIQMLSEVFGIANFTAKLIQRSGMVWYGYNFMKDNTSNELLLEDMKMVAEKFNMKSYHNLKGFLTTENILKTYESK